MEMMTFCLVFKLFVLEAVEQERWHSLTLHSGQPTGGTLTQSINQSIQEVLNKRRSFALRDVESYSVTSCLPNGNFKVLPTDSLLRTTRARQW